jgi:hypothetical protein
MTLIQLIPRPMSACSGLTVGTLFSLLHATSQAAQPVQRSRSITIPQRAIVFYPLCPFEANKGGKPASETREWVGRAIQQLERIRHLAVGVAESVRRANVLGRRSLK